MSDNKDELLDHEYDGIREFDNALPKWWLYGFYFTILFSVVYVVNYHVLPTPLWGQQGQQAEYEAEVAEAALLDAGRPKAAPVANLVALTDTDSLAKGKAMYEGDHLCMACHREDLGGLVGPNLTDDLWMHGCTPTEIVKSIETGFPLQGMLPYGSGSAMTQDEMLQVASYILAMRGTNPAEPRQVDPEREVACP